mmetsp:Transcript_25839/g.68705  ORF Transcript_25839/g.68705 Transcript_25839/m.68705 type:complete len:96 (-) Transcript_25839:189-476(-)
MRRLVAFVLLHHMEATVRDFSQLAAGEGANDEDQYCSLLREVGQSGPDDARALTAHGVEGGAVGRPVDEEGLEGDRVVLVHRGDDAAAGVRHQGL